MITLRHHGHASAKRPLSPERFSELASIPLDSLPTGVRLLATLDTGQLEGLRIPEQLNELLNRHAVRVRLGVLTEQERRELLTEDTYAALRPVLETKDDVLLGKVMVAWGPLRASLTRGGNEHASDRVALVRAVTDWYRVYVPRLLGRDVLNYLYRAYHQELTGSALDSPTSATGFSNALNWATSAADAERPQLVDLQDVPGGQRYAPHPLLAIIADDQDDDASWPVADALWSYADRYFHGDQRRDLGYSALARHAYRAAARLLDHSDSVIDPRVYCSIASFFFENEEWDNSRDWWQKAADTADPEYAPIAMVNLGGLEKEHGDLNKARYWDQQAIGSGHLEMASIAMSNLAFLENTQGNFDEARHWYRQVVKTGHHRVTAIAAYGLGNLEDEQGNFDEARHWYREVIEADDLDTRPRAMINLGNLEEKLGNLDKAWHWFRQAIETDDPYQAPNAMVNLGNLERGQGKPANARQWYRQAVATGHPELAPRAMYGLGNLERDQGDPDQARHWFQQAIDTGDPNTAPMAMVNLGVLEHEQGNRDEAKNLFRQGRATGHPEAKPIALSNLGVLEQEQGNWDRARQWFQQAIGTRHGCSFLRGVDFR